MNKEVRAGQGRSRSRSRSRAGQGRAGQGRAGQGRAEPFEWAQEAGHGMAGRTTCNGIAFSQPSETVPVSNH